jgi:hypothetical protein
VGVRENEDIFLSELRVGVKVGVKNKERGVVLFGGQKPEASTSLPKTLKPYTKLTFRRF